jgi:hypothetical protein
MGEVWQDMIAIPRHDVSPRRRPAGHFDAFRPFVETAAQH